MLSKLISRVKQEKKQPIQDDTQPSHQTSASPSDNQDKLEELFLNNRTFNIEDISRYRVSSVNSIYYIPNYITSEDERYLLNKIYNEPSDKWINLQYSNRRLQRWGGEVTKDGLENIEPLPIWLEKFSEVLFSEKITEKKTNHVLLNEYQPGIGIMPHTDGPVYHPYVVILSLGSHTCFEYYQDYPAYKAEISLAKLLIEPRSLLIFTEDAYSKYLHTIQDVTFDFVEFFYSIDGLNNNLKIKATNVDNLHLTNLFKKFSKEAVLQSNTNGEEPSTKSWRLERSKRVSLTIRFVPHKVDA